MLQGAPVRPTHHGLNRGERVDVLLEQVGELHEHAATLAAGAALAPDGVVRLLGGLDGAVDILRLTGGNVRDDLVVCGGADLDGLAVGGRRVLVVDEEADGELDLVDDVAAREAQGCGRVVLSSKHADNFQFGFARAGQSGPPPSGQCANGDTPSGRIWDFLHGSRRCAEASGNSPT